MQRIWWTGEAYTGFCWGNLKERERPLGKPRRRWEYNFKREQKEVGCGALTASSCLRRGRGDGHL